MWDVGDKNASIVIISRMFLLKHLWRHSSRHRWDDCGHAVRAIKLMWKTFILRSLTFGPVWGVQSQRNIWEVRDLLRYSFVSFLSYALRRLAPILVWIFFKPCVPEAWSAGLRQCVYCVNRPLWGLHNRVLLLSISPVLGPSATSPGARSHPVPPSPARVCSRPHYVPLVRPLAHARHACRLTHLRRPSTLWERLRRHVSRGWTKRILWVHGELERRFSWWHLVRANRATAARRVPVAAQTSCAFVRLIFARFKQQRISSNAAWMDFKTWITLNKPHVFSPLILYWLSNRLAKNVVQFPLCEVLKSANRKITHLATLRTRSLSAVHVTWALTQLALGLYNQACRSGKLWQVLMNPKVIQCLELLVTVWFLMLWNEVSC